MESSGCVLTSALMQSEVVREVCGLASVCAHYDCLSSTALSTAALTALIIAARNPPSSSASIPLMVVPAGEATAFFTYNTKHHLFRLLKNHWSQLAQTWLLKNWFCHFGVVVTLLVLFEKQFWGPTALTDILPMVIISKGVWCTNHHIRWWPFTQLVPYSTTYLCWM